MQSVENRRAAVGAQAGRPGIRPNRIALALSKTSPGDWTRSLGLVSALAGAGTLAMGSVAHAQSTEQAAAQPISEVVVTGSRVSPGTQSPTPLTTVGVDDLLTTKPGSISDAINELPIFAGSRGQNQNSGNGTTNNSGNVQNLRGLGFPRTLVLWDGHRLPAPRRTSWSIPT